MTDLVMITDQKAVTTSLIVATTFEKMHKNVLRDIDKLECSDEFRRLNFEPSSYLNEQNKPQPMFQITRDGFSFLAMGFTGKKAAQFKEAFIAEFNRMEQALRDGASETRRVDVNMNHTRGVTNPHGLDIRYNLDLTKLCMKPTKAGLAILERLTGIPLENILPDHDGLAPDDAVKSAQLALAFYEACCVPAPREDRLLFKGLYAAFIRWLGNNSEGGPVFVPSRKRFSSWLRDKGHPVENVNGNVWVFNIKITEARSL